MLAVCGDNNDITNFANAPRRHADIISRLFDAHPWPFQFFRGNSRASTPNKRVEHQSVANGADTAFSKRDGKWCRMAVVNFLIDAPDTVLSVCFWR